ncbi:MAG: DNA-directed RNA polymerase subunit alpha C-terminal domain-containing protein [Anaerolineales bacterium]|nr:DNA-directed RNA polymerase subunit alpha C-terminal domain-containing protein [Anaerolineales bacterium]
MKVHEEYQQEKEAREQKKVSADVPLETLELGTRVENSLADAEIITVADLLEVLEGGEKAMLDVKGIGRKSLIDIKKALRGADYELPEAAEEITV